MTLARRVVGLDFINPLLLASGTAGYGRELDGVMALDRLGGLVTKAVSLAPRAGNRAPRVAEFPAGMLNSVGLANPGVEAVRREVFPWLAAHRPRTLRVIANVVGFALDEYAEVIRRLEDDALPDAYELNLSCPNTSAGGIEFGADASSVAHVVRSCRQATQRPLFAKLSPVLPDIPAIVGVARDAGADGATLVNTLPGTWHAEGTPRLGQGNGGVSGPALLPVALLAVRRTAERYPDIPLIGVGGVRSAEDVCQFLHAGASLVAIGTAALADPRLPERIIRDLENSDG